MSLSAAAQGEDRGGLRQLLCQLLLQIPLRLQLSITVHWLAMGDKYPSEDSEIKVNM
jgi:hypothetical protein